MDQPLIVTTTDQIDLWRVDLRRDRGAERGQLLSPDELARGARFAFPRDRERFVRTRQALRLILCRYLDCPAAKLEFAYGEHGKPELLFSPDNTLRFNLSHCEDLALIAIAGGRNVGVDLHTLQPGAAPALEWQPVAKRSFSAAEQRRLFALPQVAQETMFHRIWCQKEAYTKGIGDGYRYGFQAFTVAVDADGRCALIADAINPRWVDAWQLRSIDVGADWIAVVAWDGPMAEIRLREF